MKVVRLSALRSGCFYHQETFLVLISAKGRVDPRDTARPEGLRRWKISMTPSRIEPATFRFVAQCLNKLYHRVLLAKIYNTFRFRSQVRDRQEETEEFRILFYSDWTGDKFVSTTEHGTYSVTWLSHVSTDTAGYGWLWLIIISGR